MANFPATPQLNAPDTETAIQSGVATNPAFGTVLVQHWYKLQAYDTGAGWVSWTSRYVNIAGAPPPIGVYVNLAVEQSWFV